MARLRRSHRPLEYRFQTHQGAASQTHAITRMEIMSWKSSLEVDLIDTPTDGIHYFLLKWLGPAAERHHPDNARGGIDGSQLYFLQLACTNK